ncbi:TauD/TfdA family dioxygenase [Streptomyces sparsogenes]|uniref:Taurine catabolism dioxygenase TauD/TfdA n=1 Tax=Streptomyces sparsogenes DSM 40356 TaxID=1331668 RepID=A0A1R1SCC5_9ACTN|nr:TauD/TfdA family dioxygenase [Streptomyces sparsogenes]OMI35848.1 taurine catabolism dioxygenase TauD/TfdA [Streptomyces sparsogenes DSM 40356]
MTSVLRRPCAGPAVWSGPDPADLDEWALRLAPARIDGIEAALRVVRERGVPLLKVSARDCLLPAPAGELERVAGVWGDGRGVVLITRVPVGRCSRAAASTRFWGLGQRLGTPWWQNAAGRVLGHARGAGRRMADPATRGCRTGEGLLFDTDGSDVLGLVGLVGLLCLRTARSGACAAVVSSAAVCSVVPARGPDLVERLYRGPFLDRREEQAPGGRPYDAVWLVSWHGGKLGIRCNRSCPESAQRFPGVVRPQPADGELFGLIGGPAVSPELRRDVGFEVGGLLLGNRAMFHCRTAYEDFAEAGPRRDVLRLWSAPGQGRGLPPGFGGGLHCTEGPARGGITPREVVVKQNSAGLTGSRRLR